MSSESFAGFPGVAFAEGIPYGTTSIGRSVQVA